MSRPPVASPASPETAEADRARLDRVQTRTLRGALVVGLVAGGVFGALDLAFGPPSSIGAIPAAGLYFALAAAYAVLAVWPHALGLQRTLALAIALTTLAAAAFGAASGRFTSTLTLAFTPMLLGAAAMGLTRAQTAALAAWHAAAVVVLGVAGGAARGGDTALQLGLVACAVAIGLLMRATLAHWRARLREREQRFAGVLATAADWYWEMDAQLRFVHVSEAAPGRSHLARDQRLGRTPWEIEDFGLSAAAMDAHRADLEARQPFTGLLLHRRGADGRVRWLSVNGRPRYDDRGVFTGYWGVGRDITAEHEAALAHAAADSRYRELFARSPSAIVLHREGVVLMANDAAATLFGINDPTRLVGQALVGYYDEDDGSRERAVQRSAWLASLPVGDAVPPLDFTLRNAAGRRLRAQVTSVKVAVEGGPAVLSIYVDQTERLRSEAARARSEALLAHVVATSPDLITLTDSATGRYVMVNEAFCALSGYARDEAIGRSSIELNVWRDPSERDRFVADLHAHGQVRDRPIVFHNRSGQPFALLVSAARFAMEGRDYLVVNGRDVTQTERARIEREAILENASIGIAMTRERRFQLANPKFEQMFGWDPGTLVGQPGEVTSVDAAAYEELGRLIGPRLVRGEAVEFERPMRRRDGSTFLCRLLARPIDRTHPGQGGTIWIAEDVTERHAVQQALARARDDAEAASRAKSAFLANTSHEIRTPLNGLVGLARLARQAELPESRRVEYLRQIDESAQALSGVISDILDLSKIEAGKLGLETIEFDLHALLESVEQGYRALADVRSLRLDMDLAPDVPRRVRGDPVRVRQILSNYVTNALKFTAAGVVRLNVTSPGAGRVRFEVEDTGPGIDTATLARLFEPFVQADDTTTRRFGGTGLGLSICRQLATLMGGHVGVASTPGQGSRFWAELPLPAIDADVGAYQPPGREDARLAGLRLLIVEDNPVNMMVAVALLEQWEVDVTPAHNGIEAVQRVQAAAASGHPFDLVLMDVQMPVQGGNEATRVLRGRWDAHDLPIIALTAAALTSERDEALAAGMNDFLTKPIDAQRLFDTLLRWRGARASA
ncbi:MAG TPA: PAS domain S-box protein [Burkholderiaceae bacterium]|nr:PAS domain S-box protein [Burkholderiaceae bacterium]